MAGLFLLRALPSVLVQWQVWRGNRIGHLGKWPWQTHWRGHSTSRMFGGWGKRWGEWNYALQLYSTSSGPISRIHIHKKFYVRNVLRSYSSWFWSQVCSRPLPCHKQRSITTSPMVQTQAGGRLKMESTALDVGSHRYPRAYSTSQLWSFQFYTPFWQLTKRGSIL